MSVIVTLTWKKGKTWVAAITGTDRTYGLKREWCSMQSKEDGKASYVLEDGLYEAQDGKEPFARKVFEVQGEVVTVLATGQLLAKLGGKSPTAIKQLTPEEQAEAEQLRKNKVERDELRRLREEQAEAEQAKRDAEIEAAIMGIGGSVTFTNEGGFEHGH